MGEPARAGRGLYSAHAAENGAPETYFNEVLIAVNLVLSFEPNPFTAVMIAREIPAAIRPYSMAVAAVSSFKNLEIIFTLDPIALFCPSKPFWIDNVRASLAALECWIAHKVLRKC